MIMGVLCCGRGGARSANAVMELREGDARGGVTDARIDAVLDAAPRYRGSVDAPEAELEDAVRDAEGEEDDGVHVHVDLRR